MWSRSIQSGSEEVLKNDWNFNALTNQDVSTLTYTMENWGKDEAKYVFEEDMKIFSEYVTLHTYVTKDDTFVFYKNFVI